MTTDKQTELAARLIRNFNDAGTEHFVRAPLYESMCGSVAQGTAALGDQAQQHRLFAAIAGRRRARRQHIERGPHPALRIDQLEGPGPQHRRRFRRGLREAWSRVLRKAEHGDADIQGREGDQQPGSAHLDTPCAVSSPASARNVAHCQANSGSKLVRSETAAEPPCA